MATRAILTILVAVLLAYCAPAESRWQKIVWDGCTVWSVASPLGLGPSLHLVLISPYPHSFADTTAAPADLPRGHPALGRGRAAVHERRIH
ncbi:hypothetical protein JXA88_11075 [Candidatus Fermentibacteria bacterium]|nr:hypothetical protein [Candidatus Fermentibacteria bacterium]